MMDKKGFTLIELIVVIAIMAVLSSIILFSVSTYIAKGRDANIQGNLAVLMPSGEKFYDARGGSYADFCSSHVVTNTASQIPKSDPPLCGTGICCAVNADGDQWAACAQEFANPLMAYCVDSRGIREEICAGDCTSTITVCPDSIASCSN